VLLISVSVVTDMAMNVLGAFYCPLHGFETSADKFKCGTESCSSGRAQPADSGKIGNGRKSILPIESSKEIPGQFLNGKAADPRSKDYT
jgi:hypothetical protein